MSRCVTPLRNSLAHWKPQKPPLPSRRERRDGCRRRRARRNQGGFDMRIPIPRRWPHPRRLDCRWGQTEPHALARIRPWQPHRLCFPRWQICRRPKQLRARGSRCNRGQRIPAHHQGKDMSETKFDCYSLNNEDFTTGEAGDALDDLDGQGELEEGREYYLGVSVTPKPSSFFDFGDMIDRMQALAFDGNGEHAESYLNSHDLPDTKRAELKAMIETWLDANVTPAFYKVTQVQRFTVTQADIDEFRSTSEAA
ncbi:hypothetical protein G6F22_014945 [Rhizopus arrhizus]|nr:hypothetical protein G6F22_014945 [Rhizopus arrhizus]